MTIGKAKKMIQVLSVVSLMLCLMVTGEAFGSPKNKEAETAIGQAFPNAKIESIRLIKELKLYEVVVNGQVFYLSEDYRYVILGNIIDISAMKNITQERSNELMRVDFSKLDLKKAVKLSSGKNAIAVFTDPDCPYCQKYHAELKKLKDVSVYIFLFPLEKLHPKAKAKSISAWCSLDKVSAINKIFDGKEIPAKECDNPISENIAFAAQNRINGTPATIFSDGSVKNGYISAEQLQALLKLEKSKQK